MRVLEEALEEEGLREPCFAPRIYKCPLKLIRMRVLKEAVEEERRCLRGLNFASFAPSRTVLCETRHEI